MKRIFRQRIATPLALAALLSLVAPGLAHAADTNTPPDKPAANDPHHPDKAGNASNAPAQPEAQGPSQTTPPDGAAGADMMGGMMKGGMMKGGMGMMGSNMMSSGMMGRCDNPAVVINVFPSGQMSMGQMRPMGMMGGQSGDDGMGMMGMMGMGDMSGVMADAGAASAKAERKDMSAEDVRGLIQSRLDRMPHGPAKVSDVTALDDNLFSVQLLNEMGEKMHRLVVNRHTGKMMQAD